MLNDADTIPVPRRQAPNPEKTRNDVTRHVAATLQLGANAASGRRSGERDGVWKRSDSVNETMREGSERKEEGREGK